MKIILSSEVNEFKNIETKRRISKECMAELIRDLLIVKPRTAIRIDVKVVLFIGIAKWLSDW